jgi:hypothetical protein
MGGSGGAGGSGTGGTTGGSGGSSGGGAGRGGSTGGSGGATAGAGGTAGTGGSAGTGGTAGTAGSAGAGTGGGGSSGTGGGAAGTGGTGTSCDPVAQTGCATGQRCSWVWTSSANGHNACLADGTVSLGGACTVGVAGEATGFDNCKKGTSCVSGVCETICSTQPADTCPTNYGCNLYSNAPFNVDGMSPIGFCEPTCDPLTQKRDTDGAAACGSPNPSAPTKGCFGYPGVKFTCATILSTTKTSEVPAGTPAFRNSCAPGYLPLLPDMSGSSTVICVALCKPTNVSSASTTGAAGLPGSGSTCPDRGAGPPNECRYWGLFEDTSNGNSAYTNTLGVCVDYPHYKYDSNNDTVLDTVWPSCTTLSPTAHTFDATLTDTQVWGCQTLP